MYTPNHGTGATTESRSIGLLINFLKENELNYGVAADWHAYRNMCKSNGEIVLASCLWNAETNELYPAMKHMWGNSESYYNPENYPVRSFLLLAENETVADSYYELASEVKKLI